MLGACAVLGVLLQTVGALRKAREGTKQVAGVPILNYRYRHLQTSIQTAGPKRYDWILKFKDGSDDAAVEKFCGGKCWSLGHPGHGGVPLATVQSSEEELLVLLEQNPGMIEFVEPDSPVELEPDVTIETAVETTQTMWNLEKINKGRARFTGSGVHIYVMDTGIRTSHRDFRGRAIPTLDTIAGRGSPKECGGDAGCATDSHGHGTHVAGTAGGASYGVATQARLHAMKVCCGSGTNINAGMDWISRKAKKPAVMTMSLGSYSTPASSRVAVDAVVASGVTVVVSAGNRGTDSCKKSYTFIASALGVGASTPSDTRASFSNWGTCNAIFAPGTSIVSASHRSDSGSATMSGTSMAAPLTAGASALLLQENPKLTPAGVRQTLRKRATQGVLKQLKGGDPNLLLNVGPA